MSSIFTYTEETKDSAPVQVSVSVGLAALAQAVGDLLYDRVHGSAPVLRNICFWQVLSPARACYPAGAVGTPC